MVREKSSIILITSRSRAMVEYLTQYPKVEGSSPVVDSSTYIMFYDMDGQS